MLISQEIKKIANLCTTKSECFRKRQSGKGILVEREASVQLLSTLIDLTAARLYFGAMTPALRRKNIIDRMHELESSGSDCMGCSGTCCTYEANSMMVTPIEALELVDYLKSSGQFDDELKVRLEENVAKYRLDQGLGNGKRSFLRRTYTCPFFNHKELGCPLPREVKPFGCLAFNAHHPEIKAKEFCYSEKEVLEKREAEAQGEEALNEEIKTQYQLYWDKTPLPVALLDFFKN